MTTIQKGKTNNVGTKFWEICDDAQAVITEFNHNRFPHILSGVEVYFMDLDFDPRLCENVQVAADVDEEIRVATPGAGIESTAEEMLRDYVMRALLHALDKQGSSRTKYLGQLRDKMIAVRSNAVSKGSKVTVAILTANGIA